MVESEGDLRNLIILNISWSFGNNMSIPGGCVLPRAWRQPERANPAFRQRHCSSLCGFAWHERNCWGLNYCKLTGPISAETSLLIIFSFTQAILWNIPNYDKNELNLATSIAPRHSFEWVKRPRPDSSALRDQEPRSGGRTHSAAD